MIGRRSRSRHPLPFLAFLLVVMVGCRDRPPAQPGLNEPGLLICNDECADRGQCGRRQDNQLTILANEGGPAVTLHDRSFPNNTGVTVVETNERQLLPARSGVPIPDTTPFPHVFFRVADGGGKTAWVAGWCIIRP